MAIKTFVGTQACIDAAEAVGRKYASAHMLPWPMQPDFYSPGRQPQPAAAFFQKYYVAPMPAVAANPALGIPSPLPDRVQVDTFMAGLQGVVVPVASGQVTLDFTALTADALGSTPSPPFLPMAVVVTGAAVADQPPVTGT